MSYTLIGSVFSLVFLVIAALATKPTYRFAPIFLIPLLWAVYLLRKRIRLHPFHFFLFGLALLAHNLGAFGLYQRHVFQMPFDSYVHFYFGLVGALIIHRALAHYAAIPFWQIGGMTILFVMGTGAIHEIYEYGSYLVLGEEKGMLKPSTSSWFDTHRDLTANFLGCLLAYVALGLNACVYQTRGRRKEADPVLPPVESPTARSVATLEAYPRSPRSL